MSGLTGLSAAVRRLRRRRVARLWAIAVALVALAVVLVPLAVADIGDIGEGPAAPAHQAAPGANSAHARTARARSRRYVRRAPIVPQATLTIGPNLSTAPVPSSFFGISTEYWSLPQFGRDTPAFERVLSLLHVAGDGPLILRIGGDSADHSFWSPRGRKMPDWAYALTPAYLARLRALVTRDRVKLIVDLNLLTDTPFTAAAWAHAAETSLPHGSIAGFEIGNEPDLYERRYWVDMTARSPLSTRPMPLDLTPATYVGDFADYARVLGEGSPDIPLIGPAVGHPRLALPFVAALIGAERPELGMVTGHLYPYSKCAKDPKSSSYPTVARLLSRHATSAFATDLSSAVALAHQAGLKFRLTEFNSVTCGGKIGVSNTFATALWAPDALFTAMRAGVDGANLHVRDDTYNAPFTIDRSGLHPRPLLYGLEMFTRTLGPQAQLVRLHLAAARSLNLSAWAVQIKGRILHVLLIDKGSRSVRVDLRLPTHATGTVQRLLAPSPYSRSGVTLDGQQLNYAGEWTGAPRTETITPTARGGYELTVARRSAALMSVPLATTPRPHSASEHHRRVAVTKHAVLAVGLDRPRKR
ncbi:MAG TPA: glycosyl hydrolase family 79 C-terminal domain-containing protein [Solirubrobacteraceae bacterium]|nr:glycosyl hydrolase family 79 C-terminal domain-containing protein [Solirubrobacteraceae bacterium]